MIGPAPVLAAIVAMFHVSAYVFIRGRAGARLPLLLVAAWLGAWAGDSVGGRIAADPLRIGEFNLVFASLVAWLAIALVAILAMLVPERTTPRQPVIVSTQLKRGGGAGAAAAPGSIASDPEPQAQ
ncbi:MAG TPA: hypothetical protein VFP56_03195 [Candidatus Limnocylindrales bacterium]|nr:hypothetical protein [Candidatus Limnocylindrales bacterium]